MNPDEATEITCPYCGERIDLVIDCTAGSQEYVEDCRVCCQPISLRVTVSEDGEIQIDARREDD